MSRKTVETHKCKTRLDSTLLAGADCEDPCQTLKIPPRTKESAAVFSGSEAPHIFSHGNCGLCDTLLQVLTSFLPATTKQIHSESVHIYTTLTLWQSLIKDSPCFQSPLQRQKRVTVWLRAPTSLLDLFHFISEPPPKKTCGKRKHTKMETVSLSYLKSTNVIFHWQLNSWSFPLGEPLLCMIYHGI